MESNPEELELVRKALTLGYDGCVEWDTDVVERLREELAKHSLGLIGVKKHVIEHVRNGGTVTQKKETREGWIERREYWYRVIVPLPMVFKKGLFVEIELVDADPELPEIELVNAHEQK